MHSGLPFVKFSCIRQKRDVQIGAVFRGGYSKFTHSRPGVSGALHMWATTSARRPNQADPMIGEDVDLSKSLLGGATLHPEGYCVVFFTMNLRGWSAEADTGGDPDSAQTALNPSVCHCNFWVI